MGATDDVEEETKDLLRDFMRWIYSRLKEGYEYVNSDEAIGGDLTMNEVPFLESGRVAESCIYG